MVTGGVLANALRSSVATLIRLALDQSGVMLVRTRVYSIIEPSFDHLPSKNRSRSFSRRPSISGGVAHS